MIRFRIVNWQGRFEDGEITIDSDSPTAQELAGYLQTDIDERRNHAETYIPGVETIVLEVLGEWRAEILEQTEPPLLKPGEVY